MILGQASGLRVDAWRPAGMNQSPHHISVLRLARALAQPLNNQNRQSAPAPMLRERMVRSDFCCAAKMPKKVLPSAVV